MRVGRWSLCLALSLGLLAPGLAAKEKEKSDWALYKGTGDIAGGVVREFKPLRKAWKAAGKPYVDY
jgi:hypothetical protein